LSERLNFLPMFPDNGCKRFLRMFLSFMIWHSMDMEIFLLPGTIKELQQSAEHPLKRCGHIIPRLLSNIIPMAAWNGLSSSIQILILPLSQQIMPEIFMLQVFMEEPQPHLIISFFQHITLASSL